jgi:MarR family transcriptional regulator, organic hydroperoxide resistance regulator
MASENPVPESPLSVEDTTRSIIRQLRMVIRAMQGHSRRVERACGLSAAQLWALWELERFPGLKVGELAQRMSVHVSTASNLLDKLEQAGLVARQRRECDQRVVRLYLTEAGHQRLQQAPAAPQGELNRALQAMAPDRLCLLETALQDLVRQMSGTEPLAGLQPYEGEG